jgi:hypothetical protein
MALAAPLITCRSKPKTEGTTRPSEPVASARPRPTAAPAQRYGEPVGAGEALAVSAVLAEPEKYRGKSVILEGEVRRACTRKGCWLELSESAEDPSKPGCRVTFKDYGFFVPTNSGGAHARLEGVVDVNTIAASHVRHLEEEGATFARKQPDGTAKEVRVVATGVELRQ